MTRKPVDVLLLNPPLSLPMPYLSIPVLASYLRSQGISVAAYDVNGEFYYRFITRENVRRGISHAAERLQVLNGREELRFTEMIEYISSYYYLTEVEKNLPKVTAYLFPFSDWKLLQQLDIDKLLMTLATLPYFPEILVTKPQFMYTSPYYEFSSKEIMESTGHESFYSAAVREIMEDLLSEYDPKLIGISLAFSVQALPAFLMARFIKEIRPECHLTIGGTFVSSYMRSLRDDTLFRHVDSFVLDEGEFPLVQLLREYAGGKPDLRKVQNLIFAEKGEVIYTGPAEPFDLEKSSAPDYGVFPLEKYTVPREDLMILFRIARGCPWQKCTFCRTDIPQCSNFQQPSPELLYEQFREVVKQTGARRYYFTSDSADPLVLEYFARRIIDDGLKIDWYCHTRVDLRLTRERCELYGKSGCTGIYLGVETFNDRILKLMNKGITSECADRVLRQVEGALDLRLYMMVGFPGETREEALEDFRRVQEYLKLGLIKDYHFSPVQILQGSAMYRDLEKYGITSLITTEGADLEGEVSNFTSSGMSLQQVIEFFQQYAADRSKIFPEFFSSEGREHRSLRINGREVEAAFDIAQIVRTVDSLWEFAYLTKSRWLALGESRIAPLKPMLTGMRQ
ncbi:MAG: radical SAM protein [Candidatus Eremiobacteraeota bacterium]|nr:radical SAM protein [Candidatus Eremiobacteraeota bacterium]